MICKQPSIYKNSNGNKLISLNLNDYNYESLIDNINYLNGFDRRGSSDEFLRYYEDLSLLSMNLNLKNTSSVSAANWVQLFTLISDKFWFSDYQTNDQRPVGVLGENSGAILTIGTNSYGDTNKNIELTGFTGNKSIDYKDVFIQEANYGVVVTRCYAVVKK